MKKNDIPVSELLSIDLESIRITSHAISRYLIRMKNADYSIKEALFEIKDSLVKSELYLVNEKDNSIHFRKDNIIFVIKNNALVTVYPKDKVNKLIHIMKTAGNK